MKRTTMDTVSGGKTGDGGAGGEKNAGVAVHARAWLSLSRQQCWPIINTMLLNSRPAKGTGWESLLGLPEPIVRSR